jgi:toxin ParE1/3/4
VPATPVQLRERAVGDIDAAIDHYLGEGGAPLARRFVDAVEHALRRIGRNPRTGSRAFAHEIGIPELRASPVAGFPYLVFYVERDDHVDVWRVLHSRREITANLTTGRE